jgi:cytochrome c5
MSQEHDSHEGPIKTLPQFGWAVFLSLVVPILGAIMLAYAVTSNFKPAAGSDAMEPQRVAERLRPVAHIEIKDASDTASLKTGDQVYKAQCAACHDSGAAGAPKYGDAGAWGGRIGQGYAVLLEHVLKGKGAMGAQGGGDFSDYEIGRAVVYLANQGGAKFEEPKAPAAPASAPQ